MLSAALLLTIGCEPPPPPPKPTLSIEPVAYDALSGWSEDDLSGAMTAFRRSCQKLTRLPRERVLSPNGVGGTVENWFGVCREAVALSETDTNTETVRAFFERHFQPHRISWGDDDQGLFTGYYEAELHGAWNRKPPYTVPIFRRPNDLITADLSLFDPEWKDRKIIGRIEGEKFVPYFTRSAIETGALAGRDLEMLWVDDPVDAFFLHIQGSGRVRMTDGSIVRVGYAGKNGRPYVAIGRPLIERGAIPKETMSMRAIRDWLAAHPDQMDEVLNLNPSYVFFRQIDGEGPIGAQGVALTPGRSLAVDTKLLPLGAPVWLETTDPLTLKHRCGVS